MSAVMSTLSMISGGRRAHRKLASSRKSGQLSDAGEERARHHDLTKQQRSASLQTLEAGGGGVANLENLEAKMASIEVSLGAGRRRSAGARDAARELDALRSAVADKDTLIQNLKKQLSASLSAARLAAVAAASPARAPDDAALSADERRALDERAAAVRTDLDARKNNIQDLRKKLEKTHVTENIDTRIQQAELQYKLGREELELLSLGEQARALAQLIEQADAAARRHERATLYSTVREAGGSATLVAAEARDGSWSAAAGRAPGLTVDWPGDNPALRTGDRVVEVNGTSMVSCRSAEELQRALGAAPARLVLLRPHRAHSPAPSPTNHAHSPVFTQSEAASLRAELGALRAAAAAAERAKDNLRADNTRLTHRISYLEDQVAEMLKHSQLQPMSSSDSSCITVNKSMKNVTNISISSEPRAARGELQVFQKGPDVTALVARLPGLEPGGRPPPRRPRSNASGASERAAPSPRASPPPRARHSLSHQCLHAALDYGAETDAAIRMIERNQRHMERRRLHSERRSDDDLDRRSDRPDGRVHQPADRIEESIKKTNWAERKTLSIIEQLKRSQRLRKLKKNDSSEDVRPDDERAFRRIDGKVLENAHKSSRRSSKLHSRSAKSSEFESECSDFPTGEVYGSSPRVDGGSEAGSRLSHYRKNEGERPAPPRKPLRLSLHRARSAHSLAAGSEPEPDKRPAKRSHAGGGGGGGGRSTPRPARRAGLAAPPDRLYPEPPLLAHHHLHAAKWC